MNFYNIIYNGINNNNKGNLKAYFIREYKIADRDYFYNTDDFFTPLFQKVENYKIELNKKFEGDKFRYKNIIQKASRNELEFYDYYLTHCLDKQGIIYEEYKEQENKKWFIDKTKELAEFGIDKVKTTRIIPSLTFAQVELIEKGLIDAKNEISTPQNNSTTPKTPRGNTTSIKELKAIWLPEPKITVENFLTKGIEKGIWTEEYKITVKKGGLYSTGKTLLGSLSIALRGYAISEHTDYKVVGQAFCNAFNEPIKETTKSPYKAFSSGNTKVINVLKKAYNIKQ